MRCCLFPVLRFDLYGLNKDSKEDAAGIATAVSYGKQGWNHRDGGCYDYCSVVHGNSLLGACVDPFFALVVVSGNTIVTFQFFFQEYDWVMLVLVLSVVHHLVDSEVAKGVPANRVIVGACLPSFVSTAVGVHRTTV